MEFEGAHVIQYWQSVRSRAGRLSIFILLCGHDSVKVWVCAWYRVELWGGDQRVWPRPVYERRTVRRSCGRIPVRVWAALLRTQLFHAADAVPQQPLSQRSTVCAGRSLYRLHLSLSTGFYRSVPAFSYPLMLTHSDNQELLRYSLKEIPTFGGGNY